MSMKTKPSNMPFEFFQKQKDWTVWLNKFHAQSPGVWLRLSKKSSDVPSVMYAQALEIALCYGWIDGQKKSYDDKFWLQKFTPRGPKSIWSKINRAKVNQLIADGKMKPAGFAVIESAKKDGRWKAAYDSQKTISLPEEFQAALDKNAKAKAFYATLNSANRYAILFRIQTAKKAETRTKRIQQFITMLAKHEKLH